jgi:hypothetical protein
VCLFDSLFRGKDVLSLRPAVAETEAGLPFVPAPEVPDMLEAPVEVLAARGGRGRTMPVVPGVGKRLVLDAFAPAVAEILVLGVVVCGVVVDDV